MKKIFYIILILAAASWYVQLTYAGEHGGKEHGGTEQEHGGQEVGGAEHGGKEHGGEEAKGSKGSHTEHSKPAADEIRKAMKDHVLAQSAETGSFDVDDEETGNTRRLALVKVHERVGKTGDYYYSCADFTDIDSSEMLDLDLDVEDEGGELSVVDVRIHKLNGKERYTYDDNDNRIPLPEE